MTDVITQLRNFTWSLSADLTEGLAAGVMEQAAIEIEQLREEQELILKIAADELQRYWDALSEIATMVPDPVEETENERQMRAIAQDALRTIKS